MNTQIDTRLSNLEIIISMIYSTARSYFETVSVDSILHTDVLSDADSMMIASGSAILLSHSVERFCYTFNERRFKNTHVDKLTSAIMCS